MSLDPIRVYGFLDHVAPGVAEALEEAVELTELEYEADGSLHLEYEGSYFFLEDLLEALEPFLTERTTGRIDYIDQDAFTLHRHKFLGRTCSDVLIDLNDVMQHYTHEQ